MVSVENATTSGIFNTWCYTENATGSSVLEGNIILVTSFNFILEQNQKKDRVLRREEESLIRRMLSAHQITLIILFISKEMEKYLDRYLILSLAIQFSWLN